MYYTRGRTRTVIVHFFSCHGQFTSRPLRWEGIESKSRHTIDGHVRARARERTYHRPARVPLTSPSGSVAVSWQGYTGIRVYQYISIQEKNPAFSTFRPAYHVWLKHWGDMRYVRAASLDTQLNGIYWENVSRAKSLFAFYIAYTGKI